MALTSPAYQEALHQLNPEQRAAVDLIEGPVLVSPAQEQVKHRF